MNLNLTYIFFTWEGKMNLTIRATKENDALELCDIQKAAFLPLYEKYHDEGNPCLRGVEDISNRLNSDFFRYFTILADGEIVGGILYRCKGSTPLVECLAEGQYYLQRVYIKPQMQCQGIAHRAILLCEQELTNAKQIFVDFPEDLEKNKRCYEKAGFVDTGERSSIHPNLVLASYEKIIW